MIKLNLEDILQFVKKLGFDAQPQPETNQVYVSIKIEGRDFPLFIRIMGKEMIQILVFMPYKIHDSNIDALARLLHLLNREMDIPGFGIDEPASIAFYRTIVPSRNHEIDSKLLEAYMKSIPTICETYAPLIEAILAGSITFEEILKKSKEQEKAQP